MHLAYNAPAGAALTQMRPQLNELCIARFAIDERREQGLPALAFLARLNPGVAREEGATAFVEAAVDLCPAPTGLCLNLVVGVALCAQPESAHLLWLEPLERFGRLRYLLKAERALLRRGAAILFNLVEVDLV